MRREKKTTILLLAGMVIIAVGLFVINYKSPTSFLEPQDQAVKEGNNTQYLKNKYPELSEGEREVLLGKKEDEALLNKLYEGFSNEPDTIGTALCQKLYAEKTQSDSLFTLAGQNLLKEKYGIQTQEDADFLFPLAQESFEKALKINENNLEANNGLALCYIDYNEQVMKGVGLLQHSLSIDSNNVEAIKYLGFLSIKSNQLEKAIERFKKLVNLQPRNPEHYNNLSEVYLRMGDKQKAQLYLEMGKNLNKN